MDRFNERFRVVAWGVAFEGGLAAVAWGLSWFLDRPLFQTWHGTWRGLALGVLACLPMLLGAAVLLRCRCGPVRRLEHFFDEVVRPLLGACTWPEIALLSLAAGLGEELLFREVIQGALGAYWGEAAGLAAASLLFGLAHPITPLYVVLASLIGAYLGLCWLLTGNLLVVVAAHALYDFVMLLVILRADGAAGR